MALCRTFLAALICMISLAGCPPSPYGFQAQELLWPDGAPGALGSRRHDEPRLFFYYPDPEIATDTAIVIASGGSYGHHGGLWPEAVPTARWLVGLGITAVVVRYRVGERGGYDHRAYMADGARAIQVVRARATELGISPSRVGMIGYSAGGHLAASLATRCPATGAPMPETPIALPDDAFRDVSCRPDFAAALYPVVTMDRPHAYERSRKNLLGDETDPPRALLAALSVEQQVTATTAPMFVVASKLDTKVEPANSVLLYDALVAHNVDAQLMLTEDGRHGVALARHAQRWPEMSTWPAIFVAWMQRQDKLELR